MVADVVFYFITFPRIFAELYDAQVGPPPAREGGVMVESVDELLEKLKNEAGVLG